MSLKSEYNLLKNVLEYHDCLYFEKQAPIISDDIYDILKQRFLWLSVRLGLDAEKIGATPSLPQIKHDHKMVSLDSGVGDEYLNSWINRIEQGRDPYPIIAQHKIDGLAISLKYVNGKLIYGATRGDGINGEDVTFNIRRVKGIPSEIDFSNAVIRGELYIPKVAFAALDHHFVSARNAASGIIRKMNSSDEELSMLQFLAYEAWGLDCNYTEAMTQVGLWGFQKLKSFTCNTGLECLEVYHNIKRDDLDYAIDGIVFKINSTAQRDELGYTARAPRWAIACKFTPREAIAKVLNIIFQVGRTGLITPVIELEPIIIDNTTITRVSMHNLQLLKDKDLRVGDTVVITRAGDVIPYVKMVLHELRNETLPITIIPTECPSCGTHVIYDGCLTRCPNGWLCSQQAIGKLKYFLHALNIKALSDAHLTKLYNLGLVKEPIDLFVLEDSRITSLKGWGKRSWARIKDQFIKPVMLSQAINALGINGVGEVSALSLAKYFGTWQSFIKSIEFDIIEGIGLKTAESIRLSLKSEQKIVECLTKYFIIQDFQSNNDYNSEIWVITGELHMPRSEIQKKLKARGVTVKSDITKKVHRLICGENPGSKLEKAKKLGIQICDQVWLEKWLNAKL